MFDNFLQGMAKTMGKIAGRLIMLVLLVVIGVVAIAIYSKLTG